MQSLLKLVLAASIALSASVANATFINSTSGVGSASGSYDEATGQGSLTVVTYDRGVVGTSYSQLVNTFATAGTFSFDWQLFTGSRDNQSVGGYLLNGNSYQLAFSDNYRNRPSGTTSVTLAAGDTFGWYVESYLQSDGSSGIFSLSNASFTASPSAVPVPAAAWLFGSALLGVAGLRRKQQA